MYKAFLIAAALIAPIMGQDTPPAPLAHHGAGAHHGGAGMGRMHLSHKLVMDKFDVNKDGKIDDTEKAAIKAESDKLKEARQKEMLAKFDKDSDGKLSDEEKKTMRAAREARSEKKKGEGKRGEGKHHEGKHHEGEGKKHDGGHHAHVAPDRDVMIVGMALFMEKYDTDKDGKISEEERTAVKTDMEAARKACAEKAPVTDADAAKE